MSVDACGRASGRVGVSSLLADPRGAQLPQSEVCPGLDIPAEDKPRRSTVFSTIGPKTAIPLHLSHIWTLGTKGRDPWSHPSAGAPSCHTCGHKVSQPSITARGPEGAPNDQGQGQWLAESKLEARRGSRVTRRGAATCGHLVTELPTVWTARRCEVREMTCGGEISRRM